MRFDGDGLSQVVCTLSVDVPPGDISTPGALTIVKTITSTGPYEIGDLISYQVVVENTGGTAVTGVTVTDSITKTNISDPNSLLSGGVTVPGGVTYTVTYDYRTEAGDESAGVSNIACVDGDGFIAGLYSLGRCSTGRYIS